MTASSDLLDADHSLLIRAREAWLQVRDAQGEGRRLADAVVSEARVARNTPALVAALRARGWAEREMMMFDAAKATLDEATNLARRHGLPGQLAEVLATRASVHLERGGVVAARRDIAAARMAVEDGMTAEIDAQAAIIEDAVGNLAVAADLYRDAIRKGGEEIPVETAFTLYNNLGLVLAQLGDLPGSAEALDEASAIAAQLGRNKIGYAKHNQALTALLSGAVPQALRHFEEAERIFLGVDMPLGEHYMERIDAFMTLRLLPEALDVAERAVGQLERAGFRLLVGEARLRRARAKLAYGDPGGAARDADRAVVELGRHRGPVWRAQAHLVQLTARVADGSVRTTDLAQARRCATVLEAAGFLAETIDALLLAGDIAVVMGRDSDARLELTRIMGLPRSRVAFVELRRCIAAGRIAALDGNARSVRRWARTGLDLLGRFRSSLPTTELRALAGAHGVELVTLAIESALRGGRPRDVLAWIERGRVVTSMHDPPRHEEHLVAEDFARLREVIDRQRDVPVADPEAAARLRTDQARLEARIQRRLRTEDPALAIFERPASVAEAEAGLAGRVLLEFAEVRGRLIGVALGDGRARLLDLGGTMTVRQELDGLLFGLRRLVRARSDVSRDAARTGIGHAIKRLDALLVAAMRSAIGSDQPLIIAPPAILFSVPWHALPTLAGRPVSVVPSTTIWLRANGRARSDGGVVLIAGPGLPGAEAEVATIAGRFESAQTLTGSRALVGEVGRALDGARIAHIACHGTFRADNPSFSSLELWDGPLTVLDIERLRRAPELVVLAACDSGVSQVLPGDELLGLVSALLSVGTRAVVASVVPVPDVESTPLMVGLHEELGRGRSIAEALGAARAVLDVDTPAGLVTSLAFGCFGVGDITVGEFS